VRYEQEKTMKRKVKLLKAAGAMMLVFLAAGCATTTTHPNTAALSQAGFRTITPSTQAQEAKLSSLPTDRFTEVARNGNTYYIYPDAPNNRAFVGGVAQYETFQSMQGQQPVIGERLGYSDTSMDWSAWNGWSGPSWFGPARRHERRVARREFRRGYYGY
jgi:hypothetical protein